MELDGEDEYIPVYQEKKRQGKVPGTKFRDNGQYARLYSPYSFSAFDCLSSLPICRLLCQDYLFLTHAASPGNLGRQRGRWLVNKLLKVVLTPFRLGVDSDRW